MIITNEFNDVKPPGVVVVHSVALAVFGAFSEFGGEHVFDVMVGFAR